MTAVSATLTRGLRRATPGSVRRLLARARTKRSRSQLQLLWRLAQRQVALRYKETALGAVWSVITALILLALYSVVFTVVFESRWTTPDGEPQPYALFLFSGLLLFNFFAEIVNGATYLVQSNVSLIKRTTVSPRILPIASSIASLVTLGLSSIAFVLLYGILLGLPPATAFLAPLLVIPLFVLCTGLAFILAGVAAYVRDIQQVMPLITTAVLFLSAIFVPTDVFPEPIQAAQKWLTPLGVILPASKDLLFFGRFPAFGPLALYTAVALGLAAFGWWFYGKLARGFPDVV